MQNFAEIAQTLIESGAGIEVRNRTELFSQVNRLLKNRQEAQQLGEKGFQVIREHQGATDKNMKIINKFIQYEPRRDEKHVTPLDSLRTER